MTAAKANNNYYASLAQMRYFLAPPTQIYSPSPRKRKFFTPASERKNSSVFPFRDNHSFPPSSFSCTHCRNNNSLLPPKTLVARFFFFNPFDHSSQHGVSTKKKIEAEDVMGSMTVVAPKTCSQSFKKAKCWKKEEVERNHCKWSPQGKSTLLTHSGHFIHKIS